MIPDAAGLKSLRGVVLQFFHKFLSICNPQGGFRRPFSCASICHTNIQVSKIPAADAPRPRLLRRESGGTGDGSEARLGPHHSGADRRPFSGTEARLHPGAGCGYGAGLFRHHPGENGLSGDRRGLYRLHAGGSPAQRGRSRGQDRLPPDERRRTDVRGLQL